MTIHTSLLQQTLTIARAARANGNHPFGALLADADGNVLLTAENAVITTADITAHAELALVRLAAQQFTKEQLQTYTLYSSTEPCPMCSGAIFWSGIGRVVYALGQPAFYQFLGTAPGDGSLALSCRDVLAHGTPVVAVEGPFIEQAALAVHAGFWTNA